MFDQWRAGFLAVSLNHVEHTRRQAFLVGDPSKDPGGHRGVLGGFQHGRVAADERREDLPGDVGDWRVGGDDQSRHPDRLANRRDDFVRHAAGRGPAVEPLAFAGHKEPQGDGAVGFAQSLARGFTGFAGDDLGDLLAPFA